MHPYHFQTMALVQPNDYQQYIQIVSQAHCPFVLRFLHKVALFVVFSFFVHNIWGKELSLPNPLQ